MWPFSTTGCGRSVVSRARRSRRERLARETTHRARKSPRVHEYCFVINSTMQICLYIYIYIQVASLAQLLSPRWPTVSNPAPDSSLCRAAAPRLHPLASRLRPLQLLLAAYVRFESAAAPGPDCIRFNCCSQFASASCSCCSPIALASAAAACSPLASHFSCCSRSRPLRLLLPDCVRFGCCSPIALAAPAGFQSEHSSRSSRFSKKSSPAP